ncbi:uncharacterized protein BDV17DRAFT_250887 [Aspergillus undulatus]|uniref:uncharacterized protein n=1 Tax=Aspergillus undulatus TaxID=1810928 RepID=UPI003CCE3808
MLTSCPFCEIAAAHPPVPPSRYLPTTDTASQSLSPPQPTPTPTLNPGEEGHAFLILSTKHILAFLDIMPLTQGHLLVVPRNHYEKLGEVGVLVSRELGTWLPVLSRAVMRTVFGETETEAESTDVDANSSSSALTDPSWNWNVVQNNGTLPSFHFLILVTAPRC